GGTWASRSRSAISSPATSSSSTASATSASTSVGGSSSTPRTPERWFRSPACPAGTPPRTSARAALLVRGLAAQRDPEDRRHRDGQQPPRVDACGHERRGCADRDHDACGGSPVVADDEVPPEPAERLDAPHANAIRRRLSIATAADDSATTNASTAGREASSPGQCAP